MKHLRPLLTAVILLVSVLSSVTAYAAPANSDVGVSPALINLVVKPHQTSISYQAIITNNSTALLSVSPKTEDFTSVGLGGTLQFLTAKNGAHDLASSITISPQDLIVQPHSSASETITINNTNSLQTGGHYGAVLFSVNTLRTITNSNVAIHRTIASLVFLTTNGYGTYALQLTPVKQPLEWLHLPTSTDLVFSNTGNNQESPEGYIVITNPAGKLVSKTIINPDSALILPSTSRLLQTSLSPSSTFSRPGRYREYIYYRPTLTANFKVESISFIYVNLILTAIILVIIGLVLCVMLLILMSRIKRTK